jgi:hypothetical protein
MSLYKNVTYISGLDPKNWEDGKAGGQDLCNKATMPK